MRRTGLQRRGVALHKVTLHVGAGTFLPVKAAETADHHMHAEEGHVSAETAAALNDLRRAAAQKALDVLDELLAIAKQPGKTFLPGCSLTAAESCISLGQIDRAKAHLGDAKKAAAALARSGSIFPTAGSPRFISPSSALHSSGAR